MSGHVTAINYNLRGQWGNSAPRLFLLQQTASSPPVWDEKRLQSLVDKNKEKFEAKIKTELMNYSKITSRSMPKELTVTYKVIKNGKNYFFRYDADAPPVTSVEAAPPPLKDGTSSITFSPITEAINLKVYNLYTLVGDSLGEKLDTFKDFKKVVCADGKPCTNDTQADAQLDLDASKPEAALPGYKLKLAP